MGPSKNGEDQNDPAAIELGKALKRLRGRRSLRMLENEQDRLIEEYGGVFVSRSRLSEMERGTVPPLRLAAHLDKLYRGEGWVAVQIRNLWRSRWDPWADNTIPGVHHVLAWPAPYAGLVWIKIVPTRDHAGAQHTLTLEWGSWRRDLALELRGDGAIVTTGKAGESDVSVQCHLISNLPVLVLHGTVAASGLDGPSTDIRHGWVRRDQP